MRHFPRAGLLRELQDRLQYLGPAPSKASGSDHLQHFPNTLHGPLHYRPLVAMKPNHQTSHTTARVYSVTGSGLPSAGGCTDVHCTGPPAVQYRGNITRQTVLIRTELDITVITEQYYQNSTEQNSIGQNDKGQNSTGQKSTLQKTTGYKGAGQNLTRQNSTRLDRTKFDNTVLNRTVQDRAIQGKTVLDRTNLERTVLNRTVVEKQYLMKERSFF